MAPPTSRPDRRAAPDSNSVAVGTGRAPSSDLIGRLARKGGKGRFYSPLVLALNIWISRPITRAASCASRDVVSAFVIFAGGDGPEPRIAATLPFLSGVGARDSRLFLPRGRRVLAHPCRREIIGQSREVGMDIVTAWECRPAKARPGRRTVSGRYAAFVASVAAGANPHFFGGTARCRGSQPINSAAECG